MAFSIPKAKRYQDPKDPENVGPGSYDPKKQMLKKHLPEWGFGTQSRNLGYSYNDSLVKAPKNFVTKEDKETEPKKPAGMFGGLKLYDLAHTATIPGPGQYNTEAPWKIFETASTKFGHDRRFSRVDKMVPGPGKYSFEQLDRIKQSAPNFGFGSSSRSPSNKRVQTPGPGQYNAKGVIGEDGPSKSIGLKPSPEILEKEAQRVPGPGAYSPNVNVVNKQAPQFGIGTSQRYDFTKNKRVVKFPGPGNYNPTDVYVKTNGQKWGFGSENQRPSTHGEAVPGPGTYEPKPEKKLSKSPEHKIGTSKRFDFTTKKGAKQKPGPGNYTPNMTQAQTKSETWVFGTEKRPGSMNRNVLSNPGPDHYEVTSPNSGPKYHMGMKYSEEPEQRKMRQVPGPGAYETKDGKFADANMLKEPSYRIGTAQRLGDSKLSKARRTPGPGNYNTIETIDRVNKKSPEYRIGSAKRIQSFADRSGSPHRVGPGTYESRQFLGAEGIKNTMSMKFDDDRLLNSRNVPGPGQYESTETAKRTMKTMPSYRIGTAQRPTSSASRDAGRSPSPSQYSPQRKQTDFSAPTHVFGTEQRVPSPSKDVLFFPGPGSYTLPPKYKQPRFAMGVKLKDDKRPNNPGPGQYQQENEPIQKKAPSYTMSGKASRDQSPNRHQTPGPGQYKVRKEKVQDGPKFVFGTSQRGQQRVTDTPGPGQYRIPSKIQDLPAYAMPERKDEFKFI